VDAGCSFGGWLMVSELPVAVIETRFEPGRCFPGAYSEN
jgi:hypothetical protein